MKFDRVKVCTLSKCMVYFLLRSSGPKLVFNTSVIVGPIVIVQTDDQFFNLFFVGIEFNKFLLL